MANSEYQALKSALLWHLDAGADAPLVDRPMTMIGVLDDLMSGKESVKSSNHPIIQSSNTPVPLGASEARQESLKLALAAQTLEDLRTAIAGFDGISIKGTATNLVFSDGNPSAPIMLVGEAPGADEDRDGKPFVGTNGQLLDKILKTAGLDRNATDAGHSLYISTVLNWRPPGNRSPTPAEVEVSLPFIERHIQIVKPKLLILCGGVAAKALLGDDASISKLRGRWLEYQPQTSEYKNGAIPIPVLATFHPAYLLQNPAQKKHVWADMLMLLEKRREMGFIQ